MREIMVSVCCITYNHEPYIRDAIEGFLMQKTDFPIEIIIHDDASTDRTPEIIEEYRQKHPQIIKAIYQTENQHSQGKRISENYVWPRVRGKYMALCEGDDFWIAPDKLQKQVDYMEKNPGCSMCFHGARVEDFDSGSDDKLVRPYRRSRTVGMETFIVEGGGFFPTASLLFRAELVRKLPEFFSKSDIGDFPLALYLASQGTVYYQDALMCVYRYRVPGSWTCKTSHVKGNLGTIRNNIFVLEAVNEYTDFLYQQTISKVILDLSMDMGELKEETWNLKEPKNRELFDKLHVRNKAAVLFRLYFPQGFRLQKRLKKKYRAIAKKAAY